MRVLPKVPAKVLPKMLSREPSRVASRLRFRGCGRGRAPSLNWEMSDRGVVTSWDPRMLPVEEDELWRPNRPRPLVATFLVSLWRIPFSLHKRYKETVAHVTKHPTIFVHDAVLLNGVELGVRGKCRIARR